ncbi:MAG: hypothetical protein M1839_001437 [Geoglossum umbratile]|nr:MAG: hypothetical protein M1839_001437 [Geoglossum umbratile]
MAAPASPTASPTEGRAIEADFVVRFRYEAEAEGDDPSPSERAFEHLVTSLYTAGLSVEARDGDLGSILLFAKVADEEILLNAVYQSRSATDIFTSPSIRPPPHLRANRLTTHRIQDYLHGVCQALPSSQTTRSTLTEAERLRAVYSLITGPEDEGGAGVVVRDDRDKGEEVGGWVDAVFPLHDHKFNREWLRVWSTRYFLSPEELGRVRDHYGEKIAFYFAFLQSYFLSLLFPTIIGTLSYLLLPSFSPLFGLLTCLWSIIFVEHWTRQEIDLAVRWGVRGVSAIQRARPEFKPDWERVVDEKTGEVERGFSPYRRLGRQALQVPFAVVASVLLGGVIAVCFAVEIFIEEVYEGPGKWLLGYVPTVLLATLEPTITGVLTRFATRLTDYENYQTADTHEAAMVQKVFVFNLITSYLPIYLIAFVYIPYGSIIAPYLDILHLTLSLFAPNDSGGLKRTINFHTDPARLRREVIYFGMTAQIIDQIFEVVVPYLRHELFRKVKKTAKASGLIRQNSINLDGIMKNSVTYRSRKPGTKPSPLHIHDPPNESAFLSQIRNEASLATYDVNVDLREMCMQFGYLTTFSLVWPLLPLCFLINNWIELRSDAVKICYEMRRPMPWRADSIGPWLENLGFLNWAGSVTTGALVWIFFFGAVDGGEEGWRGRMEQWGLLVCLIFSEQVYFGVRFFVRYAVSQLESKGLRHERREQFQARKRYLDSLLLQTSEAPTVFRPLTRGSDTARPASRPQSAMSFRNIAYEKGGGPDGGLIADSGPPSRPGSAAASLHPLDHMHQPPHVLIGGQDSNDEDEQWERARRRTRDRQKSVSVGLGIMRRGVSPGKKDI